MNLFACVRFLCLFMIEYFCNMSDIETIKILTESVTIDEDSKRVLDQLADFEQYLSEMDVTVEKKHILLHREDVLPQLIYYN